MPKKIIISKEKIDSFILELKNNGSISNIAKRENISEITLRSRIEEYYPNLNFKNNRVDHTFFDTIGPIQAYIIGFIYTDGCIKSNYKQEKRQDQWVIEIQERDIHILELMKKALNKVGPINTRKKLGGKSKQLTSALRVCSTQQINKLKEIGIYPKKSFTSEIPKIFLENKDLFRHFLRGVFDGNGCVYFNNCRKNLVFEICGNKQTCQTLATILKNEYDLGSGNIYKTSSIFKLVISGKKRIKKIFDLLYQDTDIFLLRKYNKFILHEPDLIK